MSFSNVLIVSLLVKLLLFTETNQKLIKLVSHNFYRVTKSMPQCFVSNDVDKIFLNMTYMTQCMHRLHAQ